MEERKKSKLLTSETTFRELMNISVVFHSWVTYSKPIDVVKMKEFRWLILDDKGGYFVHFKRKSGVAVHCRGYLSKRCEDGTPYAMMFSSFTMMEGYDNHVLLSFSRVASRFINSNGVYTPGVTHSPGYSIPLRAKSKVQTESEKKRARGEKEMIALEAPIVNPPAPIRGANIVLDLPHSGAREEEFSVFGKRLLLFAYEQRGQTNKRVRITIEEL